MYDLFNEFMLLPLLFLELFNEFMLLPLLFLELFNEFMLLLLLFMLLPSLFLKLFNFMELLNNVFLHHRIPLCKLINEYLVDLARKFPQVKFLRSVADVCIPNYPDKNLPSIFIYFDDQLKKQFVGPEIFGGLRLKKDGKYCLLL